MNVRQVGGMAMVYLSAGDCQLLGEVCSVAAGERPFITDDARYQAVEALGAAFGALGAAIAANLERVPQGVRGTPGS